MKKAERRKAVVIVPTYNERENIARTVAAVLDVFATITKWDMHVLVVDDTSPDKTYEVVRDLAKKDKRVHLLINPQKAGLGGAYLKGMAEAFGAMGADVIFEFDADLQHDPARIPALLAKVDGGYDLVLGSRYVKGGSIPSTWAWYRKLLSAFGNLLIMLVFTNFRIRDWTAGYRAVTRSVYEAIEPEMHSDRFTGYTFQIGFLHKAVRKGFAVAEVPIHFGDRTVGSSKLGTEYMKNTLIYIFKVRIQEILNNRFFKFLVVGGTGTLVQLVSLALARALLPQFSWGLFTSLNVALLIAVELAIVSNFVLNNLWTFADRKISLSQVPTKFVQFNIASSGSILIQFLVVTAAEFLFGVFTIVSLPSFNFVFDSGTLYVMIGIIIGLFWNFFAYNTFIWHGKK